MSGYFSYLDDFIFPVIRREGEIHRADLVYKLERRGVGISDLKQDKQKIYFMTVLKFTPLGEITRSRCMGFYFSLETAKDCIVQNGCDLFEDNYYDTGVVEGYVEGVYPHPNEEWWFKADYSNMRTKFDPTVTEIEKPEVFKHAVGFALG